MPVTDNRHSSKRLDTTRLKTWLKKFDAWTLDVCNPRMPGYRS